MPKVLPFREMSGVGLILNSRMEKTKKGMPLNLLLLWVLVLVTTLAALHSLVPSIPMMVLLEHGLKCG